MAGAIGVSVWRFSIQALSASSGRKAGSNERKGARCGLTVALVKPNPGAWPSRSVAAPGIKLPGRDFGDAADLVVGVRPGNVP